MFSNQVYFIKEGFTLCGKMIFLLRRLFSVVRQLAPNHHLNELMNSDLYCFHSVSLAILSSAKQVVQENESYYLCPDLVSIIVCCSVRKLKYWTHHQFVISNNMSLYFAKFVLKRY